MCFVLAPDIIIAAELGEKRAWDSQNDLTNIVCLSTYTVSIGDCLRKQERLSRIGLGNVIAEVSEKQIKDYFEQSDLFESCGIGKYRLSDVKLIEWERIKGRSIESQDKSGEFLRQNVLRSAYPSKTLRALSIIQ